MSIKNHIQGKIKRVDGGFVLKTKENFLYKISEAYAAELGLSNDADGLIASAQQDTDMPFPRNMAGWVQYGTLTIL